MKGFGDGARMEVLIIWKDNTSHVFVAEQMNGKTHFIDPQVNINCEDYFNFTDIKGVLAVRIDNSEFSDKVKKFIQEK